ncbi:unnamed protein product [Parnassius mnemosyne]|uniref:PHD-type domain-containing protein n=1 Tax=Parnassius mnemosyne TaxID=213953 RepID=A0AAV1MAX9_9NEOP
MVKCGACGKFLSTAEAVKCGQCPVLYHRACVGVSERSKVNERWQCPECKRTIPKGNNSSTPVRGMVTESENLKSAISGTSSASENMATSSPESFHQELIPEIRLFRDELCRVREELKDFRRDMVELRECLVMNNKRMDEMEGRISILEQKTQCSRSVEINELEQTVSRLTSELNDREQELLAADLEITNIPEERTENITHTIVLIAAKLGVSLDERDVVFADRVGVRNQGDSADEGKGRGRRVVVRLARRQLRDELLRSARVRRNATTADLGLPGPPCRFYINERLSRANRQLFYRVREATRQLRWRYSWTRRGKIYARQEDGKTAHCLRSEADLIRVFGNDAVRPPSS